MDLAEYLAKCVSNIAWHIRVNRNAINDDSKLLTDIHESLKSVIDDYNRVTGKNLDY